VGKCEAPFTSAGGHFDPGPAGNANPDANHPFHMGDIPQISAAASGKATMKVATNGSHLAAIVCSASPMTM